MIFIVFFRGYTCEQLTYVGHTTSARQRVGLGSVVTRQIQQVCPITLREVMRAVD